MRCHFCTPPKPKFYVVVATVPATGFFINSNPTAFQKNNKHFMDDMLILRQSDYPKFLKYDSYLDCTTPLDEFTLSELDAHLMADPANNYLGKITSATARQIRAVVAGSLHIPSGWGARIVQELDSEYP